MFVLVREVWVLVIGVAGYLGVVMVMAGTCELRWGLVYGLVSCWLA